MKDTVVVNDRWGDETRCKHGGYYSCQDRFNPGVLQPHKWENAMTIDKKAWTFRRDASFQDFMSINELLTTLATTVRYSFIHSFLIQAVKLNIFMKY